MPEPFLLAQAVRPMALMIDLLTNMSKTAVLTANAPHTGKPGNCGRLKCICLIQSAQFTCTTTATDIEAAAVSNNSGKKCCIMKRPR